MSRSPWRYLLTKREDDRAPGVTAGRALERDEEVRAPRARGHGDAGRVAEAPRRTDADPIRPPGPALDDQVQSSAFHARPQDAQAFAGAARVGHGDAREDVGALVVGEDDPTRRGSA